VYALTFVPVFGGSMASIPMSEKYIFSPDLNRMRREKDAISSESSPRIEVGIGIGQTKRMR
jgi:hypothetical protein